MLSTEEAADLREKAEELLAHARRDPDFRELLRSDARPILEEAGLAEYLRTNDFSQLAPGCVDYTCVISICPETCLPSGTVDMSTIVM